MATGARIATLSLLTRPDQPVAWMVHSYATSARYDAAVDVLIVTLPGCGGVSRSGDGSVLGGEETLSAGGPAVVTVQERIKS